MCAPVAGMGSDHPWCLTLASQVYWVLWGPVRRSLEQLWIRKHLWACYGFNQHVHREGSLVQNCYFHYCFHFQKEPSSFSPLGLHLYRFLCLEYTLPPFTPQSSFGQLLLWP